MNILDDIEIVDIPKRAKEIREMKLNTLKERLDITKKHIQTVPSDEDEIIRLYYSWCYRYLKERIELIENANVL